MMRHRESADKARNKGLPHNEQRDQGQPYAKEVDEYSGGGVIQPPKVQVGKRERGKARPEK
jgi:hypothetical protein